MNSALSALCHEAPMSFTMESGPLVIVFSCSFALAAFCLASICDFCSGVRDRPTGGEPFLVGDALFTSFGCCCLLLGVGDAVFSSVWWVVADAVICRDASDNLGFLPVLSLALDKKKKEEKR